MTHYMIDIETLSTEPNAMILAIAVVEFNEAEILKQIVIYPSREEQKKLKRHVCSDTVEWWMNYAEVFIALKDEPQTDLLESWVLFDDIFRSGKKDSNHVWSKSPSFDLTILKSLFQECDYDIPWNFWNEMDVRTAQFKLDQKNLKIDKSLKAHEPLADCLAQIQNVQRFMVMDC